MAGFSGRHLVDYLLTVPDRPHLVGLDQLKPAVTGLDVGHQIDLCRTEDVASFARGSRPTWVIHLAGAMPPAAEPEMWRANLGGAMSLLQGLARAGCQDTRILGIGSAAEYVPQSSGEPLTETSPCGGLSVYGRTKWAQTLLTLSVARELCLQAMIARPFNLIGPGLPSRLVAGALCEQFLRPEVEEIVVGNTKSARDFVDIRDAVAAYWMLVRQGIAGEVYNVCTGVPQTIEYLLSLLQELSGRPRRIRIDPARFRESDPAVSYGDCAKIAQTTGWQPRIGLRESVAAMLAGPRP